MPTINQLSSVDSLSGGDNLPVYVSGQGDARKASMTTMQAYFADTFATTAATLPKATPVTKNADFTVADSENVLIVDKGSACIVALPAAANWAGRQILIKTVQAYAVTSANSNVIPQAGGAASTAILSGTAGKYAQLISDGYNWHIFAAN